MLLSSFGNPFPISLLCEQICSMEFNTQPTSIDNFRAVFDWYTTQPHSNLLEAYRVAPGWTEVMCVTDNGLKVKYQFESPAGFLSLLPVSVADWEFSGRMMITDLGDFMDGRFSAMRFGIMDFLESQSIPYSKLLLDFISPSDYILAEEPLPQVEEVKCEYVSADVDEQFPAFVTSDTHVSCVAVPPQQYTSSDLQILRKELDMPDANFSRGGGHLLCKVLSGALSVIENHKARSEWRAAQNSECNSCGDYRTIIRKIEGRICLNVNVDHEIVVDPGAVILVRTPGDTGIYYMIAYLTVGAVTVIPGGSGGRLEVYSRGGVTSYFGSGTEMVPPPYLEDVSQLCSSHLCIYIGEAKRFGPIIPRHQLWNMLTNRLPRYLQFYSEVNDPLMTREHGVPDLTTTKMNDVEEAISRGLKLGLHDNDLRIVCKTDAVAISGDPCALLPLSLEGYTCAGSYRVCDIATRPLDHVRFFPSLRADMLGYVAVNMMRSRTMGGDLISLRRVCPMTPVVPDGRGEGIDRFQMAASSLNLGDYQLRASGFSSEGLWRASQHTTIQVRRGLTLAIRNPDLLISDARQDGEWVHRPPLSSTKRARQSPLGRDRRARWIRESVNDRISVEEAERLLMEPTSHEDIEATVSGLEILAMTIGQERMPRRNVAESDMIFRRVMEACPESRVGLLQGVYSGTMLSTTQLCKILDKRHVSAEELLRLGVLYAARVRRFVFTRMG